MIRVIIKVGGLELPSDWEETPVTREIYGRLPIESEASLWGDEIYFNIGKPLASQDVATEKVSAGDVAYWPQGYCLCIFFGRTPLSLDDEPVPASPVIKLGRMEISPAELRKIKSGEKIRVEKT